MRGAAAQSVTPESRSVPSSSLIFSASIASKRLRSLKAVVSAGSMAVISSRTTCSLVLFVHHSATLSPTTLAGSAIFSARWALGWREGSPRLARVELAAYRV